MTTFSLEAPSPPPPPPPPSTLLSILIPPPSIHLRSPPSPAFQQPSSSQQELISASIPDEQEKAHFFSGVVFSFFFPIPTYSCIIGWTSTRSFSSPSLLFLPPPPPSPLSSLPQPALLPRWLATYFSSMLLLSAVQSAALEPPLLAVSC